MLTLKKLHEMSCDELELDMFCNIILASYENQRSGWLQRRRLKTMQQHSSLPQGGPLNAPGVSSQNKAKMLRKEHMITF